MKRGIRPIWRELAEAAKKVAASKNYAEEYIYSREFFAALERLERLSHVLFQTPPKASTEEVADPLDWHGGEVPYE